LVDTADRPAYQQIATKALQLRDHLETFVARAAESDPMGHGLPEWVERDFRGARARCEDCSHERLIPFEPRH
jgi:hypothetical protein